MFHSVTAWCLTCVVFSAGAEVSSPVTPLGVTLRQDLMTLLPHAQTWASAESSLSELSINMLKTEHPKIFEEVRSKPADELAGLPHAHVALYFDWLSYAQTLQLELLSG